MFWPILGKDTSTGEDVKINMPQLRRDTVISR